MLDVPNFFWESEPTLYPLYIAVREYLEIKPRIQVLNERCRVFLDLAEILSDSIADNRTSCMLPLAYIFVPVLIQNQTKHGLSSFSSSSPFSLHSPKSFSASVFSMPAKVQHPPASSPAQWAALFHPHHQPGLILPTSRQVVYVPRLHLPAGPIWVLVA